MRIYTDGACRGNGSKNPSGSFACVAVEDDKIIYQYADCFVDSDTTNNKMELSAVIHGLSWVCEEYLTKQFPVTVVSDSQYVILGITDWIKGWIKNGWINSKKEPVKNKELWLSLKSYVDYINMTHPVQWKWVRGHDGDKYNELCDDLCNQELDKYIHIMRKPVTVDECYQEPLHAKL